jgi:cell division protein FtsB
MDELGVTDLIAMVHALQSQMNSMREKYEARIAELEAGNAALKTRVADLEAQMSKHRRRNPHPRHRERRGKCRKTRPLTGR